MTTHDFVMILVMTFPMFIFAIAPALKVGDYLEEKYAISETQKRMVMIGGMLFVSLTLSAFLQLY